MRPCPSPSFSRPPWIRPTRSMLGTICIVRQNFRRRRSIPSKSQKRSSRQPRPRLVAPGRGEIGALGPDLERALAALERHLGFFAGLPFPEFERDYESVALRHPSEYPFCEGRIASSAGIDIPIPDYESYFEEFQVPHSTALHSKIRERGSYLCGPIARLNLNFDRLRPRARAAAQVLGLTPPLKNPFKALLARVVEIVQALDEALEIVTYYRPPDPSAVQTEIRAGVGFGCTEAPRGSLYHRYAIDDQGIIQDAKIVPPTSQNQWTIERDLFELAPELAEMTHAKATRRAEQAVRNYDPCISCSTHFLNLRLEHEP
jgi:sulfhydrogenase subunit alpha